ncbi:uncharacterized protein LOC113934133 [Zalophus californianus]|uniref:Uncharacterized protein LOC113934133 n=1 Tax=Zalophus californianus TaxID=9704 RepID=A0A6J2EN72_ZALCA|nr:uncharacterized protein LOC113934133 [Zalophus californianus]
MGLQGGETPNRRRAAGSRRPGSARGLRTHTPARAHSNTRTPSPAPAAPGHWRARSPEVRGGARAPRMQKMGRLSHSSLVCRLLLAGSSSVLALKSVRPSLGSLPSLASRPPALFLEASYSSGTLRELSWSLSSSCPNLFLSPENQEGSLGVAQLGNPKPVRLLSQKRPRLIRCSRRRRLLAGVVLPGLGFWNCSPKVNFYLLVFFKPRFAFVLWKVSTPAEHYSVFPRAGEAENCCGFFHSGLRESLQLGTCRKKRQKLRRVETARGSFAPVRGASPNQGLHSDCSVEPRLLTDSGSPIQVERRRTLPGRQCMNAERAAAEPQKWNKWMIRCKKKKKKEVLIGALAALFTAQKSIQSIQRKEVCVQSWLVCPIVVVLLHVTSILEVTL